MITGSNKRRALQVFVIFMGLVLLAASLRVMRPASTNLSKTTPTPTDPFEGGTVQSMRQAMCLTQQYRYRIEALRLNLCEGAGTTGECEESLKYKENPQ